MTPTTNIAKTDEEIKMDVVNELRWDTRVDASKVQVRVGDGIVTLTGSVPSLATRGSAGIDAWSVMGVTSVDNQLSVEYPTIPLIPSDTEIQSNAEQTLLWNSHIRSDNIQVSVDTGIVTLTGTVPTHWEKNRAEELVSDLRGVQSVTNELAVVPTERFSDESIAEDIVNALERSLLVDAGRVDITVTNGNVTLSGSVHSGAARRAVYQSASRTAGVIQVDNNLIVSP